MNSATTTRTLNRRPRVERQVLALLRGREGHCAADDDPGRCFAELRDLARQEGLKIMPPETAFLSSGELTLLSWLARAQRSHAPGCRPPDHPRLAAAIENCARIMSRMNLRLYPLTLYAYRIRA